MASYWKKPALGGYGIASAGAHALVRRPGKFLSLANPLFPAAERPLGN